MNESVESTTPTAATLPAKPAGSSRSAVPYLALLLAVLAIALAGYQWRQGQGDNTALRLEMAQRLTAGDAQTREMLAQGSRTVAAQKLLEERLAALEVQLAESRSQQAAVEQLYQELSRNRNEWMLAEVEQSVETAQQHLQLSLNVRRALAALESADASLQRMKQPRYAALRQAIESDITRLKSTAVGDLAAVSAGIDALSAAINGLPLAMLARPPANGAGPAAAADVAERPVWERLLREAWQELRQLVRVERISKRPALLTPADEALLRDNLRLRLLVARAAWIAGAARSSREDLAVAAGLVNEHFDSRDAKVKAVLSQLEKLKTAASHESLPDLGSTLELVRKLRRGAAAPAGE